MKWFLLVLPVILFAMPHPVRSEPLKLADSQMVLLDDFQTRCDFAFLLSGPNEALSESWEKIRKLLKTHTAEMALVAEYWDSKATRELTATLEHLKSSAHRERSNYGPAIDSQYNLYYFEHIGEIVKMIEEVSKWPASKS